MKKQTAGHMLSASNEIAPMPTIRTLDRGRPVLSWMEHRPPTLISTPPWQQCPHGRRPLAVA
jgi:hypothetical protein